MIPVSPAFQEAIKGPYRRIKGKVTVIYEGPMTSSQFTVSSEDTDPHFPLEQAVDGIKDPDMRIAVLDGTWQLGRDHLYALYGEKGWWTQSVADENGDFAEPYPQLVVDMPSRTIDHLTVIGDSIKGEYPRAFAIYLYDFDGNLLYSEEITDNALVKWEKDIAPVSGVYKAVLELRKWNIPHTKGKIVEFISPLMQEYYEDEIVQMQLTEQREMSGITLPIGNVSMNEIQVKLYNDGRFDLDNTESILYGRLKPNCFVRPYIGVELPDGTTEWVPLGHFWTTDWKVNQADMTAELRARDRLQMLANTHYYGGLKENVSLYDIAVDIFTDAGLKQYEYWVDPALQDIHIPYANIPATTYLGALKIVATAGLSVVYADRWGILRMEKVDIASTEPVMEITPDEYIDKRTPLLYGKVYTKVRVRTQPLALADTTEVYRSLEPVNVPAGESVRTTIMFMQKPVKEPNISLEGATNTTIEDVRYYAWGASVKLHNSGTADEQVIIVANGKPLVVQGAELISKEDPQAIRDYGLIVYTLKNNPLVQDRETAKTIAEQLLASYKDPQRAVIVKWIGNPALELGDGATIDGEDYFIVKQTIVYDGGLESTIETRKMTT